jgi:dihydrofolate reductase
MKTQYYTATSINGYIADENHSLDWLLQFGVIESMDDFFSNIGAAAMGSTTYEWLLDQEKKQESPRTWPYEVPIWVFSSRNLPIIENADIRFAKGDVASYHTEMMKVADGKNIWLIGGGDLVGQFHDHGLLDEIILSIAPVMLGSGAPLLPRKITSPPLKLIDIQKHEDVFATLIYKVQKKAKS